MPYRLARASVAWLDGSDAEPKLISRTPAVKRRVNHFETVIGMAVSAMRYHPSVFLDTGARETESFRWMKTCPDVA